ncbi:MAG: type IX secretion system sortase PorU [Rhodothermaceae bacterium]
MSSKFKGLNSLVVFFLLSVCVFSQTSGDLKIISSDNSTLVFEYKPVITKETIKIDGGTSYYRFGLESGAYSENISGLPQIPFRAFNIGVASEFGASIQVLHKTESTLSGKILPFPEYRENGEAVYKTISDYNKNKFTELVDFGDYGIARGMKIQQIKIHPVQFDALTGKIKIIERIVVQVNLPAGASAQRLSGEFYNDLTINSSVAKNWGSKAVKSNLQKTNSSLISSGTWYKFKVEEEGIYVISKAQLSNYGINPETVDPATIKIYNNGGYLLPESVTADRPTGLVENAIKVETTNNKVDRVIFYARGNSFWEYNKSAGKITRNKHWFENTNYYWITSGGSAGKRIAEVSSGQSFDKNQNTTKAYIFEDNDQLNLHNTGRLYVSTDEYNTSNNYRNFVNQLPDRIASSQINYKFNFAHDAKTGASKNLTIAESNTIILSKNISGSTFIPYDKGSFYTGTAKYSGNLTDNRSNLKFVFGASASSTGYLDYYEIEYLRNTKAIDNTLLIFGEGSSSIYEYKADGFTGSTNSIRIFDVTDFSSVKEVTNAYKSGAEVKFNYQNDAVNPNKFYLTTTEKYKTPLSPVKVENSDIRGFTQGVEHIIIATSDFKIQAERLATYRTTHSVPSKVFYLDEIFNEFGCGIKDPTAIRDFVKYAYNNWSMKPKFVLLFGDGSADFLEVNPSSKTSNIIPIYPTVESMNEIYSYAQEDYFAKVDGNDKYLDLAIGRICFSTEAEAKNAIDKIIAYETNSDQGLWRNKIAVVADDQYADGRDWEAFHLTQCETLTGSYISPGFDVNKIYMSTYPLSLSAEGARRRPEVVDAIINAINNDLLVINYTGHGSPSLWAHERVFTQEYSIKQLKNKNYFFMTVASCDYAKFDDYSRLSSGEELVTLADKGAIGVMAATRPVEAGGNAALNNMFYSKLLDVNNGQINSIGQALMLAKNNISGQNSSKFLLVGDPAVKLHLPQVEAAIDSVNGSSTSNVTQIKALSKVRVAGSVKNLNGTVNTSYNGNAIISVFDSERIKKIEIAGRDYDMKVQGGVIFKGSVSVTNGLFATDFVVPKDISYENKNGKIVAYIFNNETDGNGYTTNVTIGGTGSLANDNKGPEIDIYFDNINFSNSNLVNSNFKLILDIEDQTGLNTTGSGIGHKLEGIINDDQSKVIDFTNAFVGDKDAGGKSGKVEYNFSGFEAGEHKIKVKAWDVFNNPTETEEYFTVMNTGGLVLRNIYNFPNPFADKTVFTFQHNVGEPVDVKIKVYTVAGRLIREIEELSISDKFVKIAWDGRDEDGSEIANGTYFYKLIVKTNSGEFNKTAVGKLAVIK